VAHRPRQPAKARAPRARAASAPLPRARRIAASPAVARFAPSRRSLAVGLGLVVAAIGLYAIARQSSVFAISRLEVSGAPTAVQQQVKRALAPLLGTNLVGLDGAALERRAEALPTVVSVSYDRAFPHTLRIVVVPERPVAVLHRGKETWLVSTRGRVMQRIANGTEPALARIWVPRKADVTVGAFLAPAGGGTAARTLASAVHFPARIATVSAAHGELVLRLRSGVELRLGDTTDVRLKLAIARRALAQLPPGATYLDVSVPGRPVAGADNPQLSGTG
jgi:cell division protein FtsQ